VGWRIVLFFSAFILSTGISFFPQVGVILTTWLLCRFVDRRPLTSVGVLIEKSFAPQFGMGLVIAAAMFSFVIGVLLLITPTQMLSVFSDTTLSVVLLVIFLHFTFAAFEELLVRGYLLQTLMESFGPWTALLATSATFSLIHIGNPGLQEFSVIGAIAIVNLFLAGVFMGALVLKTRALWAAISFHFAWNFIQGHVYGLPVSGIDMQSALSQWGAVPELFEVVLDGPDWLTGGLFGPEASIITSIVLISGTLIVWQTGLLKAGPKAKALWQEHVPVRQSEYDRLPD
jgi:hypothetical protein